MASIVQKLIYHLKTYGLGFTVRLFGSKLFGTKNPYDSLQSMTREGTMIAHHIGQTPSLELKTQPIDAIIVTPRNSPRINLILDTLSSCSSIDSAIQLAEILKGDFRLITRCDYPDPIGFHRIAKERKLAHPTSVDLFSDFDRTTDGQNRYKLTLTSQDFFITDTVYNAVAAAKTSLSPYVFCLLSHLHSDDEQALIEYAPVLKQVCFITEHTEICNLLRSLSISNIKDTGESATTVMENIING